MSTKKLSNKKMSAVVNAMVDSVVTTGEVVSSLLHQTEVQNVIADAEVVLAEATVALNKTAVARTIFNEELAKGSERKVYINRMMKEAELTKAGASTYYQNFKKKAGLVHAKA